MLNDVNLKEINAISSLVISLFMFLNILTRFRQLRELKIENYI